MDLPVYVIDGDQLSMGPSFANAKCWVTTKGNGYLQMLFSVDIGTRILGATQLRYADRAFSTTGPEAEEARAISHGLPLERNIGTVRINPSFQLKESRLSDGLAMAETLFVPKCQRVGDDSSPRDFPAAVYIVCARNDGDRPRSLSVFLTSRLRGETSAPLRGETRRGTILAWNEASPDWVRALASSKRVAGCGLTFRQSFAYAQSQVERPNEAAQRPGDLLGWIQVDWDLEPGASDELAFFVTFSHRGRDEALRQLKKLANYRQLLTDTQEEYRRYVCASHVMTPDPLVSEGVAWSKVNMVRVMHEWDPTGWAFTNEPGVSSNVVARDAAWFTYGCDWMMPEFSRELLRTFGRLQQSNGKIPEFYHGNDGHSDDYGLNINDDTPLFVLAANHHVQVTHDRDFAAKMYDACKKAGRYILDQRDKRGLVFCSARGVEVRGIASWRNVIPNYTLNGAVTEINAECYAALRAIASLAKMIGVQRDERFFARAAQELKTAINKHLLDTSSDHYYLNIDADGNVHDDVTTDQLFPIIFEVAEPHVATEIVRRLTRADFWTSAGIRTLSIDSPDFHPSKAVGLLGGVWPGVAFWYAFAAAKFIPKAMARALHNGYAVYLRDPKKNNTVPGQFSEWFDGESLVNRGMRLSPWEPPRFLWAAIEGLCSFHPERGLDFSNLSLPPDWMWLAVRSVPFRGRSVSWFVVRTAQGFQVHGVNVDGNEPQVTRYEKDVSSFVRVQSANTEALALARAKRMIVALGNTSRYTVSAAFSYDGSLRGVRKLRISVFDSEHQRWEPVGTVSASDARSFSTRVGAYGYALVAFDNA